jgi:RHH-type transcriptional regulator, proline utilization regulon repressor / proline dehydrogenase / delta 1-pyrroline-5-carboxylate dehydrogenase
VNGALAPLALETLEGFSGALWWGDTDTGAGYAASLIARLGSILPLITTMPDRAHACHERHVCIDTTAAGGNAALLAG